MWPSGSMGLPQSWQRGRPAAHTASLWQGQGQHLLAGRPEPGQGPCFVVEGSACSGAGAGPSS